MAMEMTTLGGVASEGSAIFRASPFMKGLTSEMPIVSDSATQIIALEESWQTASIPQSVTTVVTVGENFELQSLERDVDEDF